ncbi:heterokaryon incompatibility protein-domain-containing protein [Aspergillus floccosus]
MLCSNCNNIDIASLKRMPKGSILLPYGAKMNRKLPGGGLYELAHAGASLGWFHSSYKDIYDNAEFNDCPLCQLMCKACQQFRNNLSSDGSYRSQYKHKLNDFNVYLALSDKYSQAFTYWTDSDLDEYAFLIGEIGLVTSPNDPLHKTLWGRQISPDPRTRLDWVHKLVSAHDHDHDGNTAIDDAISGNCILPPRVIFLGDGKSNMKLWEPPAGRKAKYITLSYRWPEQRITSDRYTALGATLNINVAGKRSKGGLSWSSLHETYQDVVDIAIKLNIDYLWIDALCIIQDNPADKSRQLRQMGDIYKNSYLTVCASDGLRPFAARDGIYRPNVPVYRRFQMTLGDVTGHPEAFEVPYHDVITGNQVQNFSDETVSSRGWTFQERVLSPRMLFFGQTQVYFECSEYCIGEDGFLRPGRQLKADDIPSGVNFWEYWWSLVAIYCTRELTVEFDKLVAIGGLAKVLNDNYGASEREYVAGLWTGPHVLGDLLWSVTGDQDTKLDWDARNYRAPSWSWAAVDGQVSPPVHEYRHGDGIARLVEEPVVDLKDSHNKYGEVTGGWVTIWGPRIKARVFQKLDPVRLSDGTNGVGDQYQLVTTAGTVFSRGAFIDYNVFMDELTSWTLFLLIIGKVTVDGERIYPALILIRDGEDEIRRVGTVEITRSDLGGQSLDDHPEVKYRQYRIV